MHGQSTIENCAPNNQISLYSGGGTGVITPGLPSGTDYQRPGASISNSAVNPYRNNVSSNRSPYDQKLSEAKAQEQEEIAAALSKANNNGSSQAAAFSSGSNIVSGQGTVSAGNVGANYDIQVTCSPPNHPRGGHSPLRNGGGSSLNQRQSAVDDYRDY